MITKYKTMYNLSMMYNKADILTMRGKIDRVTMWYIMRLIRLEMEVM